MNLVLKKPPTDLLNLETWGGYRYNTKSNPPSALIRPRPFLIIAVINPYKYSSKPSTTKFLSNEQRPTRAHVAARTAQQLRIHYPRLNNGNTDPVRVGSE